jgi:hypothetical protein
MLLASAGKQQDRGKVSRLPAEGRWWMKPRDLKNCFQLSYPGELLSPAGWLVQPNTVSA